jgi:hypothetical protein
LARNERSGPQCGPYIRNGYNPGIMSFKNVDIGSAMREGKFDNLPGAGKPLELEPMPANEDARMAWWALRVMRQQDFTPDEVRLRKQVDRIRGELAAATTERRVRALVLEHNEVIRQINTLGTNAINLPMAALSTERELRKLRERQAGMIPHGEASVETWMACENGTCRAMNPRDARFCRRCGVGLGE